MSQLSLRDSEGWFSWLSFRTARMGELSVELFTSLQDCMPWCESYISHLIGSDKWWEEYFWGGADPKQRLKLRLVRILHNCCLTGQKPKPAAFIRWQAKICLTLGTLIQDPACKQRGFDKRSLVEMSCMTLEVETSCMTSEINCVCTWAKNVECLFLFAA